jgi:hypothetical protein
MRAVRNSFAENTVEKKTHPKMGRKFPRQQKKTTKSERRPQTAR